MWTACLHSLRCSLKPGQSQWSWSIQDALVICPVPPLAWLEEPGTEWASLSPFRVSHPPEHVSFPLFLRSLSLLQGGWTSKRAKVEAVPDFLRLRPELSGQPFCCILLVKVSPKATQIQRERKIGESTGKALRVASVADHPPNSPNCGLLLVPRLAH